jgi:phage tail-like protein
VPPGDPKTTYPVQFWRVSAEGIAEAALFVEASLPTLTLNKAELRHVGTEPLPEVTTVAVNHSWSELTLQAGFAPDRGIWDWIKQGLPQEGGGGGRIEKKELTVELCGGEDHTTTIMKVVCHGAWPCVYTPPKLNANSNEIAMESITFAFDEAEIVLQ